MPSGGFARDRVRDDPALRSAERDRAGARPSLVSVPAHDSAASGAAASHDEPAPKAVSKHALEESLRVVDVEDWTLREFACVDSTNLVAAHLPAWHAVRAETQTAGRGRFQRTWISDQGGVWLSAVVPLKREPAEPLAHRAAGASGRRALSPSLCGMPLIAGLAVCEALRQLGVEGLRMRWPNDVMVYDRKLAGLLLDQFHPDRVVVGIGLNVHNQPAARDTTLTNHITRLADIVPAPPSIPELTALVLRHLRRWMQEAHTLGFPAVLPLVNLLWGPPRRVELALDSGSCSGLFTQVDRQGCLVLQDAAGGRTAYDPTEVRHLREI